MFAWCNGSITVSKTVGLGSNPSAFAIFSKSLTSANNGFLICADANTLEIGCFLLDGYLTGR